MSVQDMAGNAIAGLGPLSSFLLRIIILFLAVSLVTGFASSPSSSTTTTTKSTSVLLTNSTSTIVSPNKYMNQKQIAKQRMTSFSSCGPSNKQSMISNRHHGREASFFEKLQRRFTVFRVALQVFIEYKWAGRKAKKLKKRLGYSNVDDPDTDDDPEIVDFWSKVHERNASRLLKQIKNLAGFWVKVGQYLSTRADIMPPEYLKSLSELQDSMPPKSWEDTLATIQEELGEESFSLLDSIDPEPLSTASLAQVHRATIKNHNGKEIHDVVLKVQHRGVASLMLQDMENLRVILELLAKTDPDLDFGPVIREYNQEVKKELDFRTEAKNMDEVRELLKKSNIKAIIPENIPGLVRERVLVMDFCEGFPVRDTHLMDKYDVDREMLLERVCAAWAAQMHVGGLFNADPHGANILVSTAVPGDPSVPVLLDFGLTKRLDPPIKLAFARLMYASYENDVDALIQSFNEMGLKMNRHDPFEDMAAMQRGFGDTVPQKKAREVQKQKSAEYKRRVEAQRAEAGLKKGQKLRNPVEAWPSELVFFGRVTNMLRGLCSQLDVRYPYLETMAMAAKETIKASVPLEEHANELVHESAQKVTTKLQQRILEALPQIEKDGHMVGLQVCVLQHGKEIANVAAGTMGRANPRPVTPSTLFNVFSVSKGVLTIGALRLVQDGSIESLDDPVCKYWPAFANKPTITVRHLLTHQSGLANVYPKDATLDTLLDWTAMTNFIAEHAEPSHEPGAETQYHALSYAWLVGGLIEAVTGKPYEEWLDELLLNAVYDDSNKQRRELFLAGIAKHVDDHKDLAVLSLDRSSTSKQQPQPQEQPEGSNQKPTSNPNQNDDDGDDEDAEKQREKAKKVLAKYRGLQQLMNPSVFNMRKVREAKLPSANGHASAASLARIFHAVIRSEEPILSCSTLEQARKPHRASSFSSTTSSNNVMLNDSNAPFGLGFQLHEFRVANGHQAVSIGHAGLGGSVVLAVPEEQVVVALTLNHLSADSVARKQILNIIFEELGWQAPSSMGLSMNDDKEAQQVAIQ